MTISTLRRDLIVLAGRCRIPALARRYRDLATMLERLETATDWMADNLRRSIAQKISQIEQIKRDGFYANPLGHLSGVRNRTTEAGQ